MEKGTAIIRLLDGKLIDFGTKVGIGMEHIHTKFCITSCNLSTATPVKILRDTGASQSLLLSSALPFSDESYTGTRVLIKGVDSPE